MLTWGFDELARTKIFANSKVTYNSPDRPKIRGPQPVPNFVWDSNLECTGVIKRQAETSNGTVVQLIRHISDDNFGR